MKLFQLDQNAAARLLTGTRKRERLAPTLPPPSFEDPVLCFQISPLPTFPLGAPPPHLAGASGLRTEHLVEALRTERRLRGFAFCVDVFRRVGLHKTFLA